MATKEREFNDDFSGDDPGRYYYIEPGVGEITRTADGMRYVIARGPDGAVSSFDYFTIDTLGRPLPPSAKTVLKFKGTEWRVDALLEYDFRRRTNGRAAYFWIVLGESARLHRRGIVFVRTADLNPESNALAVSFYEDAREPESRKLTSTPRDRNWFRVSRLGNQFTLEWSEDGGNFEPVLTRKAPAGAVQFLVLNSSSFAGGAAFTLKSLRIRGAEVVAPRRKPGQLTESETDIDAAEILEGLKSGRDIRLASCRITGMLDLGRLKSPVRPNMRIHSCSFEGPFVALEPVKLIGQLLFNECTFNRVNCSKAAFAGLFQAANCRFSSDTRFIETRFGAGADFSGSQFSDKPYFRAARAKRPVSFYHCDFAEGADLSSAKFGSDVSIADVAVKRGSLTFYGTRIDGCARLAATLQRSPQMLGDGFDFRKAAIDHLVVSAGDPTNPKEQTGPAHWTVDANFSFQESKVREMQFYNVSLRKTVDLRDSQIGSVINEGSDFAQIVGEWPVSTEYYSCFVSYSSKDELFVKQLCADLRARGVECWFAPRRLKIGAEFPKAIRAAIWKYDRVIAVLTANAVKSHWVEHEVKEALAREAAEKRKLLLPIRLDDSAKEARDNWAAHLQDTRQIGDFGGWKDARIYRRTLGGFVRELKAPKRRR